MKNGLIFAAHTTRALKELETRAGFWERRGETLSLLDAAQTAEAIGGGDYPGALLEPRGGTLNPLAYARGLARAAMALGARIHTRSRATAISRDGFGWTIRTRSGSVDARTVILGTNAYTDRLWPGLARSLVPMRVYQLASQPLGSNLRRSLLPGGQALTDTRRMPSGVRLHPDGRLHVTTDGARFGATEAPEVRAAVRRVERLFPQLGPLQWEFSWSGWIAMTPDEYPRLHELAPGVFAALGYSGRGIGMATVLGRELARCIAGEPRQNLVLPFTDPKAVGFPLLNQMAVKTVIGYKRGSDALDLLRSSRSRQLPFR
jgi:glycine/D-amino acid oxidase-like deaminating enzyme